MTPRQLRQANIDAQVKVLTQELGITDSSNFGRSSDWFAIRTLATEDASIRQLVNAVNALDVDFGIDIGNYSNASVNTDRTRLADPNNEKAIGRAQRDEQQAMEAMVDGWHSPREIVRQRLLERLIGMGVRIRSPRELHICKPMWQAYKNLGGILPHVKDKPYLQEYVDNAKKTLAQYNITA